jgi:hypothetical protein
MENQIYTENDKLLGIFILEKLTHELKHAPKCVFPAHYWFDMFTGECYKIYLLNLYSSN